MEIFCDKEFSGNTKLAGKVESIEVCEGFPAEEILRKANEFSCDAKEEKKGGYESHGWKNLMRDKSV